LWDYPGKLSPVDCAHAGSVRQQSQPVREPHLRQSALAPRGDRIGHMLSQCKSSSSQGQVFAKSQLVKESHHYSHAKCADEHCRRHQNAQAKPGGHRRVGIRISCWCRCWSRWCWSRCRRLSGSRHETRHAHIEQHFHSRINPHVNHRLKDCLSERSVHASQSHSATDTACCAADRTNERSGCRSGCGCGFRSGCDCCSIV